MAQTSKNRKRLRRREKPRIVVDIPLELKPELSRVAEEMDWQIYDLSISSYYPPTNPSPAGAIITRMYRPGHKSEEKAQTLTCPTVRLAMSPFKGADRFPLIKLDWHMAGRMAVDYLSDAGFRDVAIFQRTNVMNPLYEGAIERAAEIGVVLHCHQLPSERGVPGPARMENRSRHIGTILSELPRPIAFLGPTDPIAARFCFDCQAQGLSIPEDIAVLGCGNMPAVCQFAPVPLSSLDMNRAGFVSQGAALLKRLLDGEPPPDEPVLVRPKGVVVRRSTDMLAVSDPRVARAISYMWDHLDWPLTVDDVCMEVDVSRATLARLFKKCLGRGVNEELRRKRLERCSDLLKSTAMTVEEISKAVGFPSTSYLYQTFKQVHGVTPRQYRAQSKA